MDLLRLTVGGMRRAARRPVRAAEPARRLPALPGGAAPARRTPQDREHGADGRRAALAGAGAPGVLRESTWDAAEVNARRLALLQSDTATAPDRRGVLVIDEHSDRKWGKHTAHVGRQYLANLGKTDSGVVSVTGLRAAETVYWPVGYAPYTPRHHFATGKADPYLPSLSRMRQRGRWSNGVTSRSCWATQPPVGWRVTTTCTTRREPSATTTEAWSGRKKRSVTGKESQAQISPAWRRRKVDQDCPACRGGRTASSTAGWSTWRRGCRA
jgi:hypothetical protein